MPLRGKLGDDPAPRDALHLAFKMGILNRCLQIADGLWNLPDSSAVRPRGSGFLWRNFNTCPHCQKHVRLELIDRLNEWGPIISRSDGATFHIVLGGRPLAYPAGRPAGKTGMMSVGFWYAHDVYGDSRESLVVILRDPPSGGVSLVRYLETIADKLSDQLRKAGCLPCLCVFDGQRLKQL